MSDSIALLRGINVGTAKRIAMGELRSLFEELGHRNVRTLLNSGNVVFEAKGRAPKSIAAGIERAIEARFKFPVTVVVIGARDLDTIIEENPLRQAELDPARHLVAFVRDAAALEAASPLLTQSWAPEVFATGSRAAYLWCEDGINESPLAKAFGRATSEAATSRNWATVQKIRAIART